MQNVLFITGTGTGVGKTIVTAALLRALRSQGINAASMKPVQTGALLDSGMWTSPDLDIHLAAANLQVDADTYALMCPYCYEHACSPHLAGREAGTYPDMTVIMESAYAQLEQFDCLLVEGAGGLLAPLDEDHTMLDLIIALQCPALVVASTGLGTINHSLLTLQVLRAANVPVLGFIFNQCGPVEDPIIEEDNPATVARMGDVEVLGILEYDQDQQMPWDAWAQQIIGLDSIIEALS